MTSARRVAFAAAKVNLSLHVLGRRADGLHDLDSLVGFADVGDRLAFTPGAPLGLTVEGPMAAGLSAGPDNLVRRAASAFAAAYPGSRLGHFTLDKRLPLASGIGGGSADAAAALRLLAAENGVAPDDPALHALAAGLGADVPVCLAGHACRMRGTGERIEPLALPPLAAVLVNPGTAVPTPAVFRALGLAPGEAHAAGVPSLAAPLTGEALLSHLAAHRNDLAPPAIAIAPAIADVLVALRGAGARLARMSGSGATCFGLFETPQRAADAADRIAAAHPAWWVAATLLGDAPPQ